MSKQQNGAKAIPEIIDKKPHEPALPDSLPATRRPPLALDSDDAAWFKLFSLLEKYGKPGMLEEAFAEPPPPPAAAAAAADAALDVNNRGQEPNTMSVEEDKADDPPEDENETRAKIITVCISFSILLYTILLLYELTESQPLRLRCAETCRCPMDRRRRPREEGLAVLESAFGR